MALFQWQKVDPASEEVERALAEAGRAAGGARWPTAAERADALAQAERSASGALVWGASPTRQRRHQATCVWWTDHVGRKHWFIEGDEYRLAGEPDPLWRCRDGPPAHPLFAVAPHHTAFRGQGASAELLVVCDCGAVGTPEALAWAGDRCGPCSDHLADGGTPPTSLAVQPHRTAAVALAFLGDRRILSLGYRDGSVYLYDPGSGQGGFLVSPGEGGGGAGAVALPGGLAVAFRRAEVVCWDLDSPEERWRVRCPGELMGLAASADGKWLAVDAVSVPYLLDAETGEGGGMSEDLSNFAFAPDGTLYAYDCDSRGVIAVNAHTEEHTATGLEFGEPEEDDCYELACSPTRPLIAAGCSGGWVWIGDLKKGRWLHAFQRLADIVYILAFAPDGRVLASGHNRTILFCDAERGTELGELALPEADVSSLAFSPDGETLAVGDDRGVVRLWPWRRMLGGAADG
jgi:hypothetical protein